MDCHRGEGRVVRLGNAQKLSCLLRLLSRPSYCDFSLGELPLRHDQRQLKNSTQIVILKKTVAAAATALKSAHVVLRCITRPKTIATPVNGSLIGLYWADRDAISSRSSRRKTYIWHIKMSLLGIWRFVGLKLLGVNFLYFLRNTFIIRIL